MRMSSGRDIAVLALVAVSVLMAGIAKGQENILLTFDNKNGANPESSLVFDPSGNLFGTTNAGGSQGCSYDYVLGCGTVFELTPTGSGTWTNHVLHSFSNNGVDGNYPVAGVVLDGAGNVYGTTQYGGTGACVTAEGFAGCGVVFELTPTTGGRWRERVLHSFQSDGVDGVYPEAGLVLDAAGDLYGTTYGGGGASDPYGTVFELTPAGEGEWTETILHNFDACCNVDGFDPLADLIFDSQGNLYSTTLAGGSGYLGTVYELSPAGDGTWTETILYDFSDRGSAGYEPTTGLAVDASGNLYGTTSIGGVGQGGAVYELTPIVGRGWAEMTLYSFDDKYGRDPSRPVGSLILDAAGNLFGTTRDGGSFGAGTVFELEPQANGTWAFNQLHGFGSSRRDGYYPIAGVNLDALGNLYGTTPDGGARGDGIVFEIMH